MHKRNFKLKLTNIEEVVKHELLPCGPPDVILVADIYVADARNLLIPESKIPTTATHYMIGKGEIGRILGQHVNNVRTYVPIVFYGSQTYADQDKFVTPRKTDESDG